MSKKIKNVRSRGFYPFDNQPFWDFSYPWLNQGLFGMFPNITPPGMSPPKATGGNNANEQQPASLWEQIGGLDGIITNMGKIQKILQMTQSMSPFMKIFTQSAPRPHIRPKKAPKRRTTRTRPHTR